MVLKALVNLDAMGGGLGSCGGEMLIGDWGGGMIRHHGRHYLRYLCYFLFLVVVARACSCCCAYVPT